MEVVRPGHADTRRRQSVQGVYLGILPGLFLRFAPIACTLFHGTRATAVFYLTAFRVVHALAKTALMGFFVNFRATYLFSAAHHINRGFLATHQLTDDLINQAILNQRFNSFWGFH